MTNHSPSDVTSLLKMRKEDFKACQDEINARFELKEKRKFVNELSLQCEEEQFRIMCSFFKGVSNRYDADVQQDVADKRATLNDLLQALYLFYISRKHKDPSYRLYLREFINLFPRDHELELCADTVKVPRRQHVFESLCRLLLLLDYDGNYWGKNKKFYKSLEGYIKNQRGSTSPLNKEEILSSYINEGSSAGSVDIFFKIPKMNESAFKKKQESDKRPACVIYRDNDEKVVKNEDLFVLIQNKYFTEEKAEADKYDINKIYNRALPLRKITGDDNVLLALMINNKERLMKKQSGAKHDDFGPVKSNNIFGLEELDPWFQSMMFDMLVSFPKGSDITQSNISTYYDIFYKKHVLDSTKDKPSLQLKFHQELIVKTTEAYIDKSSTDYKKFVWGAVPRSGKSYMIAGMIRERQYNGPDNNILIILGAKTETETQFVDMFKEYDDFKDYNIVRTPNDMKKADKQNKYILILSQEIFKAETKAELTKFSQLQETYKDIIGSGKQIDFYFDEIHKGGSSVKSGEKIVDALVLANVSIDIFVMVTATYAKPLGKYVTFLNNKAPVVLEWSYEDNQLMKSIYDIDTMSQMIDNRTSGAKTAEDKSLERTVFDVVLSTYSDKYGPNYLNILAQEYRKYPSLVLIQPQLDTGRDTTDFVIHEGIFDLRCEAMPKNQDELIDPAKIFTNNAGVIDLLKFIGNITNVGEGGGRGRLDTDCVYGRLSDPNTYNYDVLSRPHSELWFLPDKNLYGRDSDKLAKCKERAKELDIKVNQDETVDEVNEEPDKSSELGKMGLPNIEPLARGLVLNMMSLPLFSKRYCVVIITNQKATYYPSVKQSGEQYIIDDTCVYSYAHRSNKQGSVKDWIRAKELETFKEGKSLIIMTGSMLRLGISLACVDIAFNFDDIKSIDTNYQTMFRVLTEREGKDYGYYIDFYRDRMIRFIYEYAEIYGKKAGKKKFSEVLDYVALLFNVNGISLGERSTEQALMLYNSLVNELGLNEEAYAKWAFKNKNLKTTLSRFLAGVQELDMLTRDLELGLDIFKSDKETNKVKKVLTEGKQRVTGYISRKAETDDDMGDDKSEDGDSETQSDEQPSTDEIEQVTLINKLTTVADVVVPILALFSNETQCNTITECLDKLIHDVDSSSGPLCDCNERTFDTLACYLQLIAQEAKGKENFILPRDKYKSLLEGWNTLLTSDDERLSNFVNAINISFDIIRKEMGEKQDIIYDMKYDDILEIIKKYLPVRKSEKDKYGEVFTPPELINEMFDQLPKEVWSNPDLKWLDPANGVGNFPMIAFERLNKGLEKKISDSKKRKEHIVKNMLYMVELNEKNVGVSQKIFGKDANIYCGSFLEDGWKKAFDVEKFDVIMGNPPFQEERNTEDGTTAGRKRLYDKFIKNSLILLAKNGILGFITPSAWRGLGEGHALWMEIRDKQVHFLHIYSKKSGQQMFNVGSRFDLYVIENTNNTKPTKVIDEMGDEYQIQMKDWPFLPNYDYPTFKKILTTEDKGIDIIWNSYYQASKFLKEEETSECNLPVIHTITQSGIGVRYACVKKGHFGVPKVILNFNEHQYSHKEQNDYEGKYGMSQISFGIPIKSKKEGDEILKAIDTNVFKTMIAATKWGAFQTDYRMFKYFRPDWYKIVLELDKKTDKPNKQKKTKKRKLVIESKTSPNKTRKSNSSSSKSPKSASSSKSSQKGGKRKKNTRRKNKCMKKHITKRKRS